MDLHLLENIISIADEKSITKAAEKRFVTQSALNQQLQKLEKELGTPLFIRARGNWQPTEAGEAYLSAARQMLLLKQDTYNRIADYAEKSSRRLTVGLIPERGGGDVHGGLSGLSPGFSPYAGGARGMPCRRHAAHDFGRSAGFGPCHAGGIPAG